MSWNSDFEIAFDPKAIAVVGVSREPGMGFDFVVNLQQAGYKGNIYPVNPKAAGGEIDGLKAYPDLVSIPEQIDLVVVSVPSKAVPAVLEDCIAANAKNIHIFTAGFRETGEEKGIELEERIREIAKRGQLRVVGPNCMGLHVPASHVSAWGGVHGAGSGPVGFISQSGGHAGRLVRDSAQLNIGLSKVISFGNATVMNDLDFLEYLANDPQTKIICMYLEGTKNGNTLTNMVREVNRTKPVIIWKGGLTEWGARAVSSHTGSLAGEMQTWDAFYKQTGAVRVDSVEELAEMAMTFLYLSPDAGRRVALMGAGGGNSVAGADVCAREGLELPVLNDATLHELRKIIPADGTFIRNPLDIGIVMWDINLLLQAIEPVAGDNGIESLLFSLFLGVSPRYRRELADEALRQMSEERSMMAARCLIEFANGNNHHKPLITVLQEGVVGRRPGLMERVQRELLQGGVPAYLSLQRASRCLGKFLDYHDFQRGGRS